VWEQEVGGLRRLLNEGAERKRMGSRDRRRGGWKGGWRGGWGEGWRGGRKGMGRPRLRDPRRGEFREGGREGAGRRTENPSELVKEREMMGLK